MMLGQGLEEGAAGKDGLAGGGGGVALGLHLLCRLLGAQGLKLDGRAKGEHFVYAAELCNHLTGNSKSLLVAFTTVQYMYVQQ